MKTMKLLTKKLVKRFAEVGKQVQPDAIVIAKFFHPFSSRTWYATEYNPETKEFFGRVKWDFPELWYFSLTELEALTVMWLPMERDRYRIEQPLVDVIKN